MNSASQTTARVVQPDVQSPLHPHLEEVSSGTTHVLVRLKAWGVAFLNRHLPFGYEDEMGFHCGDLPSASAANAEFGRPD